MIEYKTVIEDNDYLWDGTNNQLIQYKAEGSVAIGTSSFNSGVKVAFPIPLNEEVLEAIGFISNSKAEYVNENFVVKIDGTNPTSILQIEGTPIQYVSDIQNFCRNKGTELNIDKNKLAKACQNLRQSTNSQIS